MSDMDNTLRTVTISTTDGEVDSLRLAPKVFSTGSRGYYVSGKIVGPDGKRYQCSMNLVEIGSKPNGKETVASASF